MAIKTQPRIVKFAGPFSKIGLKDLGEFYRVISTRNTLLVQPGEYYTKRAIMAELMPRVNARQNPLTIDFVTPKQGDADMQYVDEERVKNRVTGADEAV